MRGVGVQRNLIKSPQFELLFGGGVLKVRKGIQFQQKKNHTELNIRM